MGRNPKIKLYPKNDRELNRLHNCSKCGEKVKYRELYFYVDESNISITNNSKGVCRKCKTKKRRQNDKI